MLSTPLRLDARIVVWRRHAIMGLVEQTVPFPGGHEGTEAAKRAFANLTKEQAKIISADIQRRVEEHLTPSNIEPGA